MSARGFDLYADKSDGVPSWRPEASWVGDDRAQNHVANLQNYLASEEVVQLQETQAKENSRSDESLAVPDRAGPLPDNTDCPAALHDNDWSLGTDVDTVSTIADDTGHDFDELCANFPSDDSVNAGGRSRDQERRISASLFSDMSQSPVGLSMSFRSDSGFCEASPGTAARLIQSPFMGYDSSPEPLLEPWWGKEKAVDDADQRLSHPA